ncbi:bifunctional adenosylcobinamide kinase/adenosylcobinamide-phosphate guanylyltransferase [uncultured Chitinophaga sp.]|jgi:Adenosyl cobinamide kinase/adenosyl cobinamide phosphate guanylyltransferase|uniref:bifunctional adenosylcobinamide kinase/adenosylcobinamide-phosphate guanylyltransferase n=1 Tax=uncultured Chitinophaga sp. TaxID=339340 RepID=UPI0026200D96|nr:bifunctional adenosylcobinamide kinase/adenosylcobinamide-phosphate guanylyltransferase [uncultured Chitinophaga sp.]
MIQLITGGARSGKSSYAQQLALSLAEDPIYVATAKIWDDDFEARVKRHQQDRGPEWTNIEEQLYVSLLPLEGRVAVIDCVTLWLTNLFMQHKQDVDTALYSIQQEINALHKKNATIIIVTNEIGMGVHADTEIGRKFTDLQGWANQYIAQRAQKVVLMVSGIPVTIKS